MLRTYTLSVEADGSDGSATGSDTTEGMVNGRVLAVHINYDTGEAATTDVTLATTQTPTVTILTVSDNATDRWYYPRHQVHGNDGSALTYDGSNAIAEPVPVDDYLKVSVAQANDGKTTTVTILVQQE